MTGSSLERMGVFGPDELREMEAELNASARPDETPADRASRAIAILHRRDNELRTCAGDGA